MQMMTPLWSKFPAVIGVAALLALASPAAPAWSADQPKASKKEKAAKGGKAAAGKYASAATAAKGQACFGDTPRIEKVKPDTVRAGDKVTITGANFGVKGCLRSVSVGAGNQAAFTHNSDNSITVVVPPVKKKGMTLLSVTTASGESSKPVLVK